MIFTIRGKNINVDDELIKQYKKLNPFFDIDELSCKGYISAHYTQIDVIPFRFPNVETIIDTESEETLSLVVNKELKDDMSFLEE